MNNNEQNDYNYNNVYYNDPYNYMPGPQKESGLGIAGMVLGIVAFLINPFAICSILAIIFGIIGVCKKDCKKGCAIAAIILGVVTIFWDLFLTIISGGVFFVLLIITGLIGMELFLNKKAKK